MAPTEVIPTLFVSAPADETNARTSGSWLLSKPIKPICAPDKLPLSPLSLTTFNMPSSF
jgi:hypothetical protein